MNKQQFFGLNDQLTFNDTLRLLKEMEVVPESRIETLYTIKSLRNRATHGTMPVITSWDPDEPRDGTDWMFAESLETSEGYQFLPHLDRPDTFKFACRKFNCGSLITLSHNEKFSAIQYLLVTQSIGHLTEIAASLSRN